MKSLGISGESAQNNNKEILAYSFFGWERIKAHSGIIHARPFIASDITKEYPKFEVSMFTALCIGCVCVFVFGTAIRFGVMGSLERNAV